LGWGVGTIKKEINFWGETAKRGHQNGGLVVLAWWGKGVSVGGKGGGKKRPSIWTRKTRKTVDS